MLISPVHKNGSRGVAKNYRLVTLTSHIVKVFERVIRHALVSHLERHGLLPTGQHGFRAMRSTLTQLLSYWDKMLDKLEGGGGVDAISLDFAKAFDKVEHGVIDTPQTKRERHHWPNWLLDFSLPRLIKSAAGCCG